jgi:ribosomal protein S18 acetylase RimI-like enzyme
MDVVSLACRTDLALLQLGGSQITDQGDYLVVRTPHNPAFWWGNFLVLSAVPAAGVAAAWLDRFAAELPDARHVALAFDGVAGVVADLAPFAELGLVCEASTVMTATAVHEPPRPNREASYRALTSSADWAQSVDLQVATRDDSNEPDEAQYREFATRKVATNRALAEAGHGQWFGAFLDGRLVTQMGLVKAGPGLARFQWVETHPEARGLGLAGTLVHQVSRFGFDQLGAQTLVMVADPDYVAIRVYRSVGFVDGETQLQAERAPL